MCAVWVSGDKITLVETLKFDRPMNEVMQFTSRLRLAPCGGTMMEICHTMPRDGRCSAFAFGENYGFWKGMLSTQGHRISYLTPQEWQKAVAALLNLGPVPKEKKQRKRLFVEAARRIGVTKPTLAVADAAMLALCMMAASVGGKRLKAILSNIN